MIRLLHLIPTLDRSGSEKQLTLLATGLPRDEFEVHVCCLTRGGPYEDVLDRHGIPVTVLHKSLKLDPMALWRLVRLCRQWRPDIVHTWLVAGNSYGAVAARLAGVPVVVATERCVDRWKSQSRLLLDRYLARYYSRVVVNSRGVAEFYELHGIPPEKLTVIYNGVEVPDTVACDREAVRRRLQIPSGAYVAVFAGRLAPQKRVMDLIWAADILKVIRPNVYLLIIGDGPQRSRLEEFTRQCRITDRVWFLGQRSDVREMLPAMDVFWLASAYEGMPNAAMEAMAAGLPVVATNIPGTNELVRDGETGFLVPVGDRAAIAQRTFRLIEGAALAKCLGESGRRRVAECFTIECMVRQHVELYRELANCLPCVPIGIALVERGGCFLVGQRGPEGALPGHWEFPGGKCRPGETAADCAVRECREETGLEVRVQRLRAVIQHDYPHGAVELHFFDCALASPDKSSTQPRPPFRWIARADLANYRFPEANAAIVRQLTERSAEDSTRP